MMDTEDKTPASPEEHAPEKHFPRILRAEQRLEEATREKRIRRHLYTHKDVNHGEKSFAAGISIYNLLWVFFIGCIIGVVSETVFSLLRTGTVYRSSGMLYGPFNQIYGIGGVILVLMLYRFRNRNNFIIFLASVCIGLVYEYCSSWLQQLIFGSISWDYSQMPSNIGGRTNLLYGVGWGIMGLLFITHFWPWLSEFVQRIPNKVGRPLTIIFAVALAANLALSGLAVWRENQRRLGVPATNAVGEWLDTTYPDSVMKKKYPNMKFVASDPPASSSTSSSST